MNTTRQAVLLLLLFFALVGLGLGQCPARPVGKSSDSQSQEAKKCDVVTLIQKESTTLAPTTESTTTESTTTESTTTEVSTTESSTVSTSSDSTTSAPSTTTSKPEPYPCILIHELVYMKVTFLLSSEQSIFDIYLDEIRNVLLDVSMSDQDKVSLIGYVLKKCFNANKLIKKKLKAKNIADWGRVYEFMAIGISFSSLKINGMIAVLDSSGNNKLIQSVENGTANNVCGAGSSATILVLTGNMKKVYKKQTPGFDKGNKVGWTKKECDKDFFLVNPSLKDCLMNVPIAGYGTFGQFLETDAHENEKIISIGKTVLTGSPSSNVLIQSLSSSLNSQETVNSNSPAVLQEANAFVQSLSVYFTQNTDISLRLKFVSSQHSFLSSECRQLLLSISIEVVNFECDFSDVIIIAHRVTNEAVDIVTGQVKVYEIVEVDSGSGSSDIEDAMAYHYTSNNLSPAQKMQFKSYQNSVTNCVRNLYPGNKVAKYDCAMYYVKGYATNVPTLKAVFLAIKIVGHLVETATTVLFSSLGSFCGC